MRRHPVHPITRLLALVLTSLLLVACGQPAAQKPAPTPSPSSTPPASQPAAPATAAPSAAPAAPQAPAKPKALIKVKMSHYPVLIGAMFYVAKDKGFFESEGLDVEFVGVNSGTALPTSLLSGEAQFSHPTFPQMLSVKSQGKDLLYVWQAVNQVTVDLLLSNQALQKVNVAPNAPLEQRYKALKGLVISGTSPGAPATRFAFYFVRQGGYNPDKDITFQAIGQANAQAAALKQGQIDAIPASPPVPAMLETEGMGKVFISANEVPAFKNYPYHGIAVTAEYAREHPEVVRAFVRAMKKASDYLQKEKAGTLAVLKKWFPNIPEGVLTASYDYHRPIWTADGAMSEAAIKRAIDFTVEAGLAKDPVPATEGGVWTNQFIEK